MKTEGKIIEDNDGIENYTISFKEVQQELKNFGLDSDCSWPSTYETLAWHFNTHS